MLDDLASQCAIKLQWTVTIRLKMHSAHPPHYCWSAKHMRCDISRQRPHRVHQLCVFHRQWVTLFTGYRWCASWRHGVGQLLANDWPVNHVRLLWLVMKQRWEQRRLVSWEEHAARTALWQPVTLNCTHTQHWISGLLVRALDLRLDGRNFDY